MKIMPKLLYVIVKLLQMTYKKECYFATPVASLPTPLILTVWHGELLSTLGWYDIFGKQRQIDFIISEHKDGEIIARIASYFGVGSIRGSSTRGGIKALRTAMKTLDAQKDIGITPDGPKGPRYSVADGIVVLAQKKHVPIMTLNFKPSSFWRINSWDTFIIPKPFARVEYYFGEPFLLENLSMIDAKRVVKERMMCHVF